MKRIIILEPNVANKIAAGEVVERPASIVKELVENSLDAGATAITVEIRGGGIDYIRITDNGSGIPAEDVSKVFLRHATSKLTTVDDLSNIGSFGFRGEALASIAAVSKVSMRTRTADGEYGTHVVIEGGKQVIDEPCACPAGTTIEVNELFYNVPARLKFIKSQRTEAAMITDYVSRIMLANPSVSIKLINNAHPVLMTNGSGEIANTILSVYGSSVFASLYKVEYDDGYIRIAGFVGGESTARSNRVQQSVFVNHRYIKSMLISNAVQKAFLTRIMAHRFPFFVLDITISSREVDVNVHPNKLSVRFRDEERISNTVTQAVKEALSGKETVIVPGMDAFSGSIGTDEYKKHREKQPEADKTDSKLESEVRDIFKNRSSAKLPFEETGKSDFISDKAAFSSWLKPEKDKFSLSDSGIGSVKDFDPKPAVFMPAGKQTGTDEKAKAKEEQTEFGIPVYTVSPSAKQHEFKEQAEQLQLDTDQAKIIGTAFDTYIIVQQGDSIYYIDQHAAHERMLYERLIKGELRFDSQILAVPIIVKLDPVSFDCVAQNLERFEEFGYSIDAANEPTIRVDAVPNLPEMKSERFLRDVIDCLLENKNAKEIDIVRSEIITMSCKRAVKAGNKLDIKQLEEIVRAYAEDAVPLTCPHGRPVIIRIRKSELQKMFKRIV